LPDLVVDEAAVADVARRLASLVDEIEAIRADVVLRGVSTALPGSAVGAVSDSVEASWASATADVASLQRATALGIADAATEFARADEDLADHASSTGSS
jgi:hypothetical protein